MTRTSCFEYNWLFFMRLICRLQATFIRFSALDQLACRAETSLALRGVGGIVRARQKLSVGEFSGFEPETPKAQPARNRSGLRTADGCRLWRAIRSIHRRGEPL